MNFNRRNFLGTTAGAAGAMFGLPALAQVPAWAPTPGRPWNGTELKVLCVVASQFRAHEARLAQFTEATGIRVTYTNVPFATLRETLTAEMVGGARTYDLAVAMDSWVPSLANLWDPIDERVRASNMDLNALYPNAFLHAGRIDGKLLGLPIRCHVQLMFYRKDLFDSVGAQAPDTWDDVVRIGRAIQEKHNVPGIVMYYGKNAGQNLMIWYNFLWGKGVDLFDAQGRPGFNNEAGIAATRDYIGLLRETRVASPASVTFNEGDAVTSYIQGNGAMIPVWWWVISRMINPEQSRLRPEQVAFAPLPTYAGGQRSTYTNSWPFGITRGSTKKDAAWEFLRWMTHPSLERSVLLDPRETDVVSVHWSNLRDAEVNRRFNNMHNFAAQTLQSTRVFTYTTQTLQVIDILENVMNDMATGAKAVPDGVNEMATRLTRLRR
jgi:multiple sugar transport system substrate-binding protein